LTLFINLTKLQNHYSVAVLLILNPSKNVVEGLLVKAASS